MEQLPDLPAVEQKFDSWVEPAQTVQSDEVARSATARELEDVTTSRSCSAADNSEPRSQGFARPCIEITRLTSSSGPLTKRIYQAEDGTLVSDGSACRMWRGYAERLRYPDIEAFAAELVGFEANEAIALGALVSDLPDRVEIVTRRTLGEYNGLETGRIARTAENIQYRTNEPALALIDIDTKGMPEPISAQIKARGGYWPALVHAVPGLTDVTRVVRSSTSSGIREIKTGEEVKGSDGAHIYVLVQNGADIERFINMLHERCWLVGFGWMMLGKGGQLLERSLIDRTVRAPERLVFEAAPILIPTLQQDSVKRQPQVTIGNSAETQVICPNLNIEEMNRITKLKTTERLRFSAAGTIARNAYVKQQASRFAERSGCSLSAATHTAERSCDGVLLPNVVLPFDEEEMSGTTVADVLRDPDRFAGATLADPLEGIEYGRCKAKIMRSPEGDLRIASFAHGRTIYQLKHDFNSIKTAINTSNPEEVAALFIRLLLNAELNTDEDQVLRDLVRAKTNIKARSLTSMINAARKKQDEQRAQAEADRHVAERTDPRPVVTAPLAGDERSPVMRLIDGVLLKSTSPVPPIRDLDGCPVYVTCRAPMPPLHELTSDGSNAAELIDARLPAPAHTSLTRHNHFTLTLEIEKHIEFTAKTKQGKRAVALPKPFVESFMNYNESQLPRVGAIVTAPLVMINGNLLDRNGLDRERKLLLQIEPKLVDALPRSADRTSTMAGKALDFLIHEWLCDVAADFSGKCILVALALTIIERVLLPERPAFFISAGKRGCGKTTALMMVILAVTGSMPAASAWSPNDEERRKAILAYLAEGLPALVWDNIPRGSTITCPTLEKVLTTDSFSDRILGASKTVRVPAFTVMSFTGNNISPKGDMASRSLMTRLEADRIDPENRTFKHADPIAWTLNKRRDILRALYTILLANPQLRPATQQERKTRFKLWWHLCGSAVEHASAELQKTQTSADFEGARDAEPIDFNALFAAVEREDEEANELADVLRILDENWPNTLFEASEVVQLLREDDKDIATLRTFFQANQRRSGAELSSKSVGKRLVSSIGTPVPVGEDTLMLARENTTATEKSKRAGRFKVRRL